MELEKLSGLKLGKLVNSGELSPCEVIEYFADLIDSKNATLNAFTYTKFEEALQVAHKLEKKLNSGEYCGPFAGVPVALKDFLDTKAGWVNSHGGVPSLIREDKFDSEFTRASESLGAIPIGKTNAPSFGFRGTTDNKLFGPTKNPFNLNYNSGGSSGGSCAAVGGGLVPLAECGDAGGSGRIPASWCNCFGFKPSAGLIPSICRPDAWAATHPYCSGGPAARYVKDAAVLVDSMQRFSLQDPLSVPLPAKNLATRRDLKGLKIGYTFNFDIFPDCDSQIKDKMINAFKILLDCGAECVEEAHFSFKRTLREFEYAWLLGINIDDSQSLEMTQFIQTHSDELPSELIFWNRQAAKATMYDYKMFHRIRTDILDSHIEPFEKYDVILAPVTGCMPVKNENNKDTKGPEEINGVKVDPLIGFSYTYLENMTGFPSASIPIGFGKDNLPIGLQVIAKRYFDEDIFTVAYALEEANPWI